MAIIYKMAFLEIIGQLIPLNDLF